MFHDSRASRSTSWNGALVLLSSFPQKMSGESYGVILFLDKDHVISFYFPVWELFLLKFFRISMNFCTKKFSDEMHGIQWREMEWADTAEKIEAHESGLLLCLAYSRVCSHQSHHSPRVVNDFRQIQRSRLSWSFRHASKPLLFLGTKVPFPLENIENFGFPKS